ncbi:primosomal protein DnaI [Lactobacillus sp. ESL0679]|uniref:primosomal protein DnaI n=1 Tax=Lactobacillus sp. ESL0679 TaxID=2983209 RepID=UPI0023FA25ED|nr:primosomal protein DnaI [Lactobacillus sp. ESL0679]MDF7683080.1 primosomal protein DnaI [Lactobacillus sp. ESL0679]
MQSIGDIINNLNPEIAKKHNLAQIYQQVLADRNVQQFLNQHKDQITSEMIKKSWSNLYEYYLAQHKQDPVTAGYRPELFLNHHAIDLRYVPDESKIEQNLRANTKKHLHLISLPETLHDVRLSQVDGTAAGRVEALAAIQQFLAGYPQNPHQQGLYLSGSFGVGKTYLLAGVANSVAAMGKQVVFLHVPTFIAGLSSHFEDNSLQKEIDRVSQADVLLLDDIGAETLSQWSRDDVLGVILQARMDNVLPTFFSSNFAMADLEDHFKETKNALDPIKAKRLMERVRTLAKEVVVSGPNRRH